MTVRDLAITFAGGGNRSFYQLGLWHAWGERLLPRVAAMATCSAGACVATVILSGRMVEATLHWKELTRHVRRNFDWRPLLRGERPTPHGPIYRSTLLTAFADGGLERVRSAPFPVFVVTTKFPARLAPTGAVALGLTAYSAEKAFRKHMLHPTWGRTLGFSPAVFDARACETKEQLVELIIASSATPPFTPLGFFGGHTLLDGGIVDNAPAFAADGVPGVRKNLVLLTRPYPKAVLGRRGNRLYLAPARALPLDRWDYTQPAMLDHNVQRGFEEAQLHQPVLDAFLGVEPPRSGVDVVAAAYA